MKTTFTFAAALAVVALTANARADVDATPAPARPVERANLRAFNLSLLAGHAFEDAMRTGFGGRLGYSFGNGLHVGGSFVRHIGQSEANVSRHLWYSGGEVGYDLTSGPLTLRPYLGVGLAQLTFAGTVGVPGAESRRLVLTDRALAFWPGATLLYAFDDGHAFVGADARVVLVEGAKAVATYATCGYAF